LIDHKKVAENQANKNKINFIENIRPKIAIFNFPDESFREESEWFQETVKRQKTVEDVEV
jgi:hypothetical protein